MTDANDKNAQTLREREKILRDLIDDIAKKKNYKNPEVTIKAITSEGANYTSVLFLVTLKCDGKSKRLFAKVASVGENLRNMIDAARFYELECIFYTKLSKVYSELEIKNGVAEEHRFIYPKFYGVNRNEMEETVVLEDLVAQGYQTYSRFHSVDWEYATASVDALAKFHALSFAYQKENPEEFARVCKELKFEKQKEVDPEMRRVWEKMVEEKISVLREDLRGKAVKFLTSLGDDAIYKLKEPVKVPVICHGDYRASNLMSKYEGNKIKVIPVDYQTIHTGCAVADLIYFEMLGSDGAFRAEYHDRLVEYYYQQLGAALQRMNIDIAEVYPRSTMEFELKDRLPYSILLAIMILPVVLVEKEIAPSLEAGTKMEDFLLPTTDILRERFVSIVEDCDRWGVI